MPRHDLDNPAWSLHWYTQGYFPLYDIHGRFYWERLPERAIIPITPATIAKARRLSRRPARRFRTTRNSHFDAIISHLQNPAVKEYSWVRPEVVRIYRALRSIGLLRTVEAIDPNGALAGGLLGIQLPGVFIAETMFGLQPDASKFCLCQTVLDLAAGGVSLMDVQTRHDRDPYDPDPDASENPPATPHPCVRLGEQVIPLADFLARLRAALTTS